MYRRTDVSKLRKAGKMSDTLGRKGLWRWKDDASAGWSVWSTASCV